MELQEGSRIHVRKMKSSKIEPILWPKGTMSATDGLEDEAGPAEPIRHE